MSNAKTSIRRIIIEFRLGSDIADTCHEAYSLAKIIMRDVEFEFNGIRLTCAAGDRPADLVNRYWIADLERSRDAKREMEATNE